MINRIRAKVKVTKYQKKFLRKKYEHDKDGILRDVTNPNKALVGGYGTGKTFTLCMKVLQQINFRSMQNIPMVGIYTAPVHSHFVDVVNPQLQKLLNKYKYTYRFNKVEKIYYIQKGGIEHLIYLKSSEQSKAGKLVGINATDCFHDEFDVNKNEIQKKLWQDCEARLRDCSDPTQSIGTTPEKLGYCYYLCVRSAYETWDGDKLREDREPLVEYIQAKTQDNKFLADPIGYVKRLKMLYTPKQVKAYLEGVFINLVGNNVWEYFNQDIHVIDDPKIDGTVATFIDFGWNDPFYVGFASIKADYKGLASLTVFDEFQSNKTTTDEIIAKYNHVCKKWKIRPIVDYCDPAGNQHHESSGLSNIEMMKSNGLNPDWCSSRVVEGIIIGNNLFHKNKIKVASNCKIFINAMNSHSYPEAKNGVQSEMPLHDEFSHCSSAFRYLCVNEFRHDYNSWRVNGN